VIPAIRAMQGATRPGLDSEHLPLEKSLTVKGDRAEFRAARVQGGRVALLQDQGSHMLASLLGANALAYLPLGMNSFAPGDPVLVYYLPR
jgi:molybdopterin biosynthesis enzyme